MKTSMILAVCCLALFACGAKTESSESDQAAAQTEENHLPKLIYYTISEA